MPIRPERMGLYPGGSILSPEWKLIRDRIRERAGNCCERCGVRNHALIVRFPGGGGFAELVPQDRYRPGEIVRFDGDLVKVIRIVCTVAHADGELVDHSDENLRFWCQRCHLLHDAGLRRRVAA